MGEVEAIRARLDEMLGWPHLMYAERRVLTDALRAVLDILDSITPDTAGGPALLADVLLLAIAESLGVSG